MVKKCFMFVVAGLGLMLASCHDPYEGYTYFTLVDLGYMSIGDSPSKVEEILKRESITETPIDDTRLVEIYQRPLWRDIGAIITAYDYLIVYYEDRELVYWGNIDDFLTHKNPDIYNVGIVSAQKLKEVLDEL